MLGYLPDKTFLFVVLAELILLISALFVSFFFTLVVFLCLAAIIISLTGRSPIVYLVGFAVTAVCVLWEFYSENTLLFFVQDIFLALCLYIFILFLISGTRLTLPWKGITKSLGIFVVFTLFAGLVGFYYGRSPQIILLELHMLLYFFFYFILLATLRTVEESKLLVKFVLIGGGIVCLQYIILLVAEERFFRVATFHADMFPLLLGISVAAAIYARMASQRLFAISLSIMLAVGLVISLTRAEWAASGVVVLTLFVLLIIDKRIRVQTWLVAAILPVIIIGIIVVLDPSITSDILTLKATQKVAQRAETISNAEQDASLMMRVELANSAFQRFRQYPILGAGLGDLVSYKIFSHARIWSLDTSHLYVLWKMGLIGFAVYIVFLITILKRSYYVLKNTREIFFKWISAGVFSGFCGLFLLSFFSSALTKYNLNLVWAVCLAVVEYGALQIPKQREK